MFLQAVFAGGFLLFTANKSRLIFKEHFWYLTYDMTYWYCTRSKLYLFYWDQSATAESNFKTKVTADWLVNKGLSVLFNRRHISGHYCDSLCLNDLKLFVVTHGDYAATRY